MDLGCGSLVVQEETCLSKTEATRILATRERYIYTQPTYVFSWNKLYLMQSSVTLMQNDKEMEELQETSTEWHSGQVAPSKVTLSSIQSQSHVHVSTITQ